MPQHFGRGKSELARANYKLAEPTLMWPSIGLGQMLLWPSGQAAAAAALDCLARGLCWPCDSIGTRPLWPKFLVGASLRGRAASNCSIAACTECAGRVMASAQRPF